MVQEGKENCAALANVATPTTPPKTPMRARSQGRGYRIEVRGTFIHCTPASPTSQPPSPWSCGGKMDFAPRRWTEPRHCKPNLGTEGTELKEDSFPADAELRAPRLSEHTPSAARVRSPSGRPSFAIATPSSCGSTTARDLMPSLVPTLSLFKGLQVTADSRFFTVGEPPKQLRLFELLDSPASTQPLRLSEIIPPPCDLPARSSLASTAATPTPSEPPSAPPTTGPPSRLPRLPEGFVPPSLSQALFPSPEHRNGAHGAGGGFAGCGGAQAFRADVEEDVLPRRLSFAQVV